MLLDGAMDGAVLEAYVQRVLAPSLNPGDIVVVDNLSNHKVDGIRQAIASGIDRFQPHERRNHFETQAMHPTNFGTS